MTGRRRGYFNGLLDLDVLSDGVIDFEPYPAFLTKEETQYWLSAWTGNENADGTQFRVFDQDGSGGMAALWLRRADAKGLLAQPIVFMGSEGETSVIAANFSKYLWVLASGNGPWETTCDELEEKPCRGLLEFAKAHAPGAEASGNEVLRDARVEFPDFSAHISQLCQ